MVTIVAHVRVGGTTADSVDVAGKELAGQLLRYLVSVLRRLVLDHGVNIIRRFVISIINATLVIDRLVSGLTCWVRYESLVPWGLRREAPIEIATLAFCVGDGAQG